MTLKPILSGSRAVPLLLAGALLGVPIVVGIGYLVVGALGGAGAASGATVLRTMLEPEVLRATLLSLWIAIVGTAMALAAALLVTITFSGSARLDRVARGIATLPLPVPTIAAAVAILLLLSQGGWLSRVAATLQLTASPADFPALVYDPLAIGVITAVVWKEFPFLLIVALGLQSLRGSALSDTARTLGASPAQVLRRITLPLLLRGMAPSVVAVFVFVLGSLELPLILAPSSPLALPLLIQERRQALGSESHVEAYAIALLATGIALLAAAAHESLRDHA